jgi:phosphoenolpyruvate-protein kinase (PTS system EI component)
VTVLANVASVVEVRAALQAGAEGVGLVRTRAAAA